MIIRLTVGKQEMANKTGNIENLSHFVKGKSGNPAGRLPKLPGLDELLAEVLMDEVRGGIPAVKAILMALRAKALKGDIRAAEVLFDRAYGKSKPIVEYDEIKNTKVIWLGPERQKISD